MMVVTEIETEKMCAGNQGTIMNGRIALTTLTIRDIIEIKMKATAIKGMMIEKTNEKLTIENLI